MGGKPAMKPTGLLIDLARGVLKRYVAGHAVERIQITDRREFDRTFTPSDAERIRQGVYKFKPNA
jgi:hypothetical protein